MPAPAPGDELARKLIRDYSVVVDHQGLDQLWPYLASFGKTEDHKIVDFLKTHHRLRTKNIGRNEQ